MHDIVVVGGGTSGAATAYQLAKSGWNVALLERRRASEAGARWVNGIAPWMFERAGIPLPEKPELRTRDVAFLIHTKHGNLGVRIDHSPLWQVDMRLLVERLHRLAAEAGVEIVDEVRPGRLLIDNGQPVALEAEGARNRKHVFPAKLFVDASGIGGILRRQADFPGGTAPGRRHVCSAAQEVRRIRDRAGAEAFLERYEAREGDCISFAGIDGGYSTLLVQVDVEGGEVEILTGAMADGSHASGRELIEQFVARNSWVGSVVFGGSGAIPLRRPLDRIVAPGVALVGDAGYQVFPAHGSGIATGMIAGRILAESLRNSVYPGALKSLWRYQTAFMREQGAMLAAFDVIRRFSQELPDDEVVQLLSSGLTSSRMAAATLAQRLPMPSLFEMKELAGGITEAPAFARKLFPTLARMHAVYALYRLHPKSSNERLHRMWVQAVGRLFGQEAVELASNSSDFAVEERKAA